MGFLAGVYATGGGASRFLKNWRLNVKHFQLTALDLLCRKHVHCSLSFLKHGDFHCALKSTEISYDVAQNKRFWANQDST